MIIYLSVFALVERKFALKNFIKKNWRIWFGLYICIYLPWFFYLEKTITPNLPGLHITYTALDNFIPFCEYFVIPYILWFFYMIVTCFFIYFKGTDSEYLKLAFSLIIGMSSALFICMIYPNGVNLRPQSFSHHNIFISIVSSLYLSDTPTNVFPSIHVYNSLAAHIALTKSKALENYGLIKTLSLLLCISICASTVFLKQHSIIDVMGAGILMIILYIIIYLPDYRKILIRNKVSNHEHAIES